MKRPSGMFAPILRDQRNRIQAAADDMAELRRRSDEADARRNERLTRGEVLDVLETVRDHFGGSGEPVQEAIYDAFDRLRDALS